MSRILAVIGECVAAAHEGQSGALWRLAERDRQLDANLVRLPGSGSVAAHVEPALDVLLIVVEGAGRLGDGVTHQALEPGAVVWLPRSARRELSAGPDGLTYLTVHRRRPGLSIGRRSAGAAPASAARDCPSCGRPSREAEARFCCWCGAELPTATGT
ncbi:hypothetical protein [Streptomyces sp. NPDC048644]|uniref:hypothetical protein n=1 Tax=Streptomyces sp. NPDC048644 TaxID=3365582 RepID=UPI00371DAA84